MRCICMKLDQVDQIGSDFFFFDETDETSFNSKISNF